MKNLKTLLLSGFLLGLAGITSPAYAISECDTHILSVWAGDGLVYLLFTNGGSAYLALSDPNRESVLSLATTALVTDRRVVVRFAADNVNCTVPGRSDFLGMYLY
jgi:hypothetical protein